MSDELDAAQLDLSSALSRQAAAQAMARRVAELNRQLAEHQRQASDLRARLSVETSEAERWRGSGFAQMLLWLVGRLDERRAAEAEEATLAAVRLADREALIERTTRDLQSARAECETISEVDAAVETARRRVATLMQRDDPVLFREVLSTKGTLVAAQIQVKETREAIGAVDDAQRSAEAAERQLRSAHNWGTWDVLGGGLFASMIKHDHVDEALEHVQSLNVALSRAQYELSQVSAGLSVPTGLESGSSARMWDTWFDNLFSDLNMQGRIETVQDGVRAVQSVLAETRQRLVAHLEHATQVVASSETRLRGLNVR